eukprot:2592236-Pyramimonas_sp.AAC.1
MEGVSFSRNGCLAVAPHLIASNVGTNYKNVTRLFVRMLFQLGTFSTVINRHKRNYTTNARMEGGGRPARRAARFQNE